MALVEKYHVVAAQYLVDRVTSVSGGTAPADIKEGQWVFLSKIAAGAEGQAYVRRVDATGGAVTTVLGVAGDTKSTTGSSMPGVKTGWQNRVSDGFDETKASAKITVYMGGGEFATDQFTNSGTTLAATAQLGCFLKVNTDGVLCYDSNTAKSTSTVAQLTRIAGVYPSGVPGTDINGDMALGGDNANTYIEFKMLI